MSSLWFNKISVRSEIKKAGKRLWARGILSGSDGNISVKLGNRFCITSSGVSKGFLKNSDFSLVEIESGKVKRGVPSSEYRMHLEIYRRIKGVNAVVHAHPPGATALSCLKSGDFFFAKNGCRGIRSSLLVESLLFLSGRKGTYRENFVIPVVEFHPASSWELARAVAETLVSSGARVALMACHGAVSIGTSLDEAVNLMELLENFSSIVLNISNSNAEFCKNFYEASPDPRTALQRMLEVRDKLWS